MMSPSLHEFSSEAQGTGVPEDYELCSSKDCWPSFRFHWELFMLYNCVPKDLQVETFKRLAGSRLQQLSNDIYPRGHDFSEMMLALEFHFHGNSSPPLMKTRAAFLRRTQLPNESAVDFASALVDMSSGCRFSNCKERLRDQFVAGLSNTFIRGRLEAEQESLTFTRALEIARTAEEVLKKNVSKDQFVHMCRTIRYFDESETEENSSNAKSSSRSMRKPATNSIVASAESCNDLITSNSGLLDARQTPLRNQGKTKIDENASQSNQNSANSSDDLHQASPKRAKSNTNSSSQQQQHHSCQYCKYTSLYRRSVIRHERIHTGEKPFMCEFCSNTFREKQSLNDHIKAIHTRERPFSCEICKKAFTKKVNLNDHVRTHTKQTPYLCEFCGRGFAQKSALNTHVMTHIGSNPYRCTRCGAAFRTKVLLRTHSIAHDDADRLKNLSSENHVEH